MRSSKSEFFNGVDWWLVLIYFVLIGMGWLSIYSANYDAESSFSFSSEYGKQFFWILASVLAGGVILLMDSRLLLNNAYVIHGFVLLLLIGVLFTPPVKGASSWFQIGGFSLQPSEFAKISVALAVARFMSEIKSGLGQFRSSFIVLGIVLFPAFLIVLQPDPGTALVFVSFVLVMYREGLSGNILLFGTGMAILFVTTIFLKEGGSGLSFFGRKVPGQYVLFGIILLIGMAGIWAILRYAKKRYKKRNLISFSFIIVTMLGIILSTSFIFDNVLKDRHRDRIKNVLGLVEDKRGIGYNTNQAMAAIGSGGLMGKGYLDGTLSNDQYKHVPEQSTDFIFSNIGEEWGFLGSSLVILVYLTLLVKIILMAERQRSSFSRIYGYGVASILFFHLMINVAMVIGLAPVIGIPLAFFSYGGSSLLTFSVLIFIMLKLDADRLNIFR